MKALIFMLALMTVSNVNAQRLYAAQAEKRYEMNLQRCARQLASPVSYHSDPDYIGPCDAISQHDFDLLVAYRRAADAIAVDPKAKPTWPKRW